MKKISKLLFSSILSIGVVSTPIIFSNDNNRSIINQITESSDLQRNVNVQYDAIFSSSTTEGQSSSGGVFGYDQDKTIYMTTYNNALAWSVNFTEHRAITDSINKDEIASLFDVSTATLKSMKVINRTWNGETKEILYVVIEDANEKICVLPYDAVSGEDIITVKNTDGSIDWKENIFICDKNDTLMFNSSNDIFYLYRYDTIQNYQTTPVTAFRHFYGMGFREVNLSQKNWAVNIGVGDADLSSNIIVAIAPLSNGNNLIIYYDKTITNEMAVSAGKLKFEKSNSGYAENRFNVVLSDSDLNVNNKALINTCSYINPAGIDINRNTPLNQNGPTFNQYGYVFPTTDPNYSYIGYLVSGTINSVSVYKINNLTGEITVNSEQSLQENLGSTTGFDVLFTSFDEEQRVIYLSNTWSYGDNVNGKAITALKFNSNNQFDSFLGVDYSGLGVNSTYNNTCYYSIATYKNSSSNKKGVICTSSASSSESIVPKNQIVSFISSDGTAYSKLVDDNRGYFEEFQTIANTLWNCNSTTLTNRKWASNITDQNILDNYGWTPGGIIQTSNSNILESASFSVSDKESDDNNGSLSFTINFITTETSTSPATNSKIFVNIEGFRTLGNDTFVYVENEEPTTDIITSKQKVISDLKTTLFADQITDEQIMQGYIDESTGKKTSPFWYSEDDSYFNDIYNDSNPIRFLQNVQRNKEDGIVTFDIDFTSVTPMSIINKLPSGKNIKSFTISGFATESQFVINIDNFLTEKKFDRLPTNIDVNFIVNNLIDKTSTGKSIVLDGLSIDGNWLVDSQNIKRWLLEIDATNTDQLYVDNPIAHFNLYYNRGNTPGVVPDDSELVKVIAYENNRLLVNPDSSTNIGKDVSTVGWSEIRNISFKNIYSLFVEVSSPIDYSYSAPETDRNKIESIIGSSYENNTVSTFSTYGISDEVAPKELWENIKNNSVNPSDSIDFSNILSIQNFPSFTSEKIMFIDGNIDINDVQMDNGGIIIQCVNSDTLGSSNDDVVIDNKGNNTYVSPQTGKKMDSYLDLNFKISYGTETNIENSSIGVVDSSSNYFKISDKFEKYKGYLQWSNIKIVKTEIINQNPYFAYTVSNLENSISRSEDGSLIESKYDATISVQDILNSNIGATDIGSNIYLSESNSNIFSTYYEENPLIRTNNLSSVSIDVLKDNANGEAIILISAYGVSSTGARTVSINQSITITGFKKEPNWFLVYVLPALIVLLIIATIVTIITMVKKSNKNLKSFIKND